jgi:hypothetical protein
VAEGSDISVSAFVKAQATLRKWFVTKKQKAKALVFCFLGFLHSAEA